MRGSYVRDHEGLGLRDAANVGALNAEGGLTLCVFRVDGPCQATVGKWLPIHGKLRLSALCRFELIAASRNN